MKTAPEDGTPPVEGDPPRAAICDDCGAAVAVQFDGICLCPDCYSCRGACCAGEE